jgi:hypothetical protein
MTVIKLYGTPDEIRRAMAQMCAEFGNVSIAEVR